MSKTYQPLTEFLDDLTSDHVALSFDKVERIIRRKLPPSASIYVAWWSNSPVEGRHNEAWLRAGWMSADLNLKSRTVKFVRGALPMLRKKPVWVKSETPAIPDGKMVTVLKASPTADAQHITLTFEWKILGDVVLDMSGSVAFPTVSSGAGLYRLRVDSAKGLQIYIGESVDLRRRFGQYRGPSPTQQTNMRLNGLLKIAIAEGATVSVDIVNQGVELSINGAQVAVDLTDKAMRRMIEHSAIVATGGTGVEIANR
jgi:hypothetical protein